MNQGARDANQAEWQSRVLKMLEQIESHLRVIASKTPGGGNVEYIGQPFAGLPSHLQMSNLPHEV